MQTSFVSNLKMVIQSPIVKIQFFKWYEEFFESVMLLNLFQHLYGEGSAKYQVQLRDHWPLKNVQGDRGEILDNGHSVIKPN